MYLLTIKKHTYKYAYCFINQVFTKLPPNPEKAGKADINLDCNDVSCPTDCTPKRFQFWDISETKKQGFKVDPSITLRCENGKVKYT
jgi:hypothetical protein